MNRLAALICAVFPAVAAAAEPSLQVFVTDTNDDVYVALFDGQAVELAGCVSAAEARALLGLAAGSPADETTLQALQATGGFGTHPRLPCAAASFDLDWPATAPIWADLAGSGLYYLPALAGDGHYGVPAACPAIKTALAIRERLQLPGVLQGLQAPPDPGPVLVLDCGAGDVAPPLPPPSGDAGSTAWSLHRFQTFLSEDSTGDTIWVARHVGADGTPSYLPIWRVDGAEAAATLLAGGPQATDVEDGLRQLFGLPASAPVTPLGAEAVSAVRTAVHVDLCLRACPGYPHRHAGFLNPGIDLALTDLGPTVVEARRDLQGSLQAAWFYLPGRMAVLTACPRLTGALGLVPAARNDWMAEADVALTTPPPAGARFDCQGTGPAICVRRISEGAALMPGDLLPGPDCPGARDLVLELPGTVRALQPLALNGAFEHVWMTPAPGGVRAQLIVTPGRAAGAGVAASSCVASGSAVLIAAADQPRLGLQRVDLVRAASDGPGDAMGIEMRAGSLVLDEARIGQDGEGLVPLGRGITLCQADLYARSSQIEATDLAVQGIAARLLLSGTDAQPMRIARARYGVLVSSGSLVRLAHAAITAATPLVLRGGVLKADRVDLAAPPGASTGTGVLLERASEASFTTSTARAFRCVASFADAGSRATFLLPGNDLARDNTHLSCGGGQFTLIE